MIIQVSSNTRIFCTFGLSSSLGYAVSKVQRPFGMLPMPLWNVQGDYEKSANWLLARERDLSRWIS